MRRGLTGLLPLLVACSNGAFVDIRVSAPSGVERVEVFLAPAACERGNQVEECDDAMAWDMTSRKLDGAVYILDVDHATVADKLPDGTFRIDFEGHPGGHRHLSRMLFVGYPDRQGDAQASAAAVLEDVDLPADTAQRWNITLTDVVGIPPAMPDVVKPAGDVDRLHFWNRSDTSLARCVVLERWRDDTVQREFLVPPGDTDCDDKQDECDPYWWNAPPHAPSLDDASCLLRAELRDTAAAACQLGGLSCSEVGPAAKQACTPIAPTHCAASGMCDPACQTVLAPCIDDSRVAHVTCFLPASMNGDPCANVIAASIPLDVLVGATSTTCGTPSAIELGGLAEFVNPVTVGTLNVTFGPSAGSTCAPTITYSGTQTPLPVYAAMKVPLSNGSAALIGLKLKLEQGDCDTQNQIVCDVSINPFDDVTACAQLDLGP